MLRRATDSFSLSDPGLLDIDKRADYRQNKG